VKNCERSVEDDVDNDVDYMTLSYENSPLITPLRPWNAAKLS